MAIPIKYMELPYVLYAAHKPDVHYVTFYHRRLSDYENPYNFMWNIELAWLWTTTTKSSLHKTNTYASVNIECGIWLGFRKDSD